LCSPLGAIVLISGIAIWSQRRDLSFSGEFVFYCLTNYRERVCPSLCPFLPKTLFLEHPSEKTSLISVFWQGLQGPDGVNYGALLDLKCCTRRQVRCKPAVFWLTWLKFGVFSIRTETGGFTGFFPGQVRIQEKIGALTGLISLDLITGETRVENTPPFIQEIRRKS
jgi:hypothetical protein